MACLSALRRDPFLKNLSLTHIMTFTRLFPATSPAIKRRLFFHPQYLDEISTFGARNVTSHNAEGGGRITESEGGRVRVGRKQGERRGGFECLCWAITWRDEGEGGGGGGGRGSRKRQRGGREEDGVAAGRREGASAAVWSVWQRPLVEWNSTHPTWSCQCRWY
ncbi:hypothetical protein C8R44DRAFT_747839 [Mycena epipterygia]|nr:hypothetical protein C8R44DRAFT_747839 [Mycena epipterygia]